MSADPVQTLAAAQLTAAPALAAFGEPLIFDLDTDEQVHKETIRARLAATGVCLEIGSVTAPGSADTLGGVLTPLVGSFEIYAAEKVAGTHTPKGPDLWRAIIKALTARNENFACAGYDAFRTEHGYLLHVLTFTHPIFVA